MQQSGEFVQRRQVQTKSRWSMLWGSLAPVLVVLIWLLASWSASAAELALSATVGAISNGRATVSVSYTSSGHADTMIRLYVDGKRWGSSDQAAGTWQVANLSVGAHKFLARADGASPQWSNEVPVQIGSVPVATDVKRRDAARLLLQASFGPRSVADIDDVASRTSAAWLDAQFAMPWNAHAGYLAALRSQNIKVEEQHIFEAIWQNMMFADARLRARVALALSEIMVVSNIAPDQDTDALAGWMDTLYKNVSDEQTHAVFTSPSVRRMIVTVTSSAFLPN